MKILLMVLLPFFASTQTLSSYIVERMNCPPKPREVVVNDRIYQGYQTDCCVIFINNDDWAYVIPTCKEIGFADSISAINDKNMQIITETVWIDGYFIWEMQEDILDGKYFIITKNGTKKN